MIKLICFDFDIKNNEYIFKGAIDQQTGEILQFEHLVWPDENALYYCDDLSIFYIYLIKYLTDNGFSSSKDVKCEEKGIFNFNAKSGKCSSFTIYAKNKIEFIDFKAKFGVNFGSSAENEDLINQSIKKARSGKTLGHDAFYEFIRTVYKIPDDVLISAKTIRKYYPLIETTQEMLEAKYNCSGYQFFKRGYYENVYEYDQESAYPAQLLCDAPQGKPKIFERLEDVPPNYFKVITFTAMDVKLKNSRKIDFVDIYAPIQTITLTDKLFDLFIENYEGIFKIKQILAFKTHKKTFNKFINENILKGKIGEKRPHIAKYNKYIANALTGYFGRNEESLISYCEVKNGKISLKKEEKKIEPVYLPVYLFALDKSKAEFIRTLQKHLPNIIYANTDGFLTTQPISLDELNFQNSCGVGMFKQKKKYASLFIECINGYAGITEAGEISNTIAGLNLARKVTPEEYEHKNLIYTIKQPTATGKVRIIYVDSNGKIVRA